MLLALAAGCSSTASVDGERPASQELPNWVLVVPVTDSVRAYYVGGCSAAPDAAAGVAEAEADARSQAERAVREHMLGLVDRAFRHAGVELTSTDRGVFRTRLVEPVVERLAAELRREDAFHRECPASSARDGTRGVCDVFVLMSADVPAWDRLQAEVLAGMRKRQQAEGGASAAVELLDWMLRHANEDDPGAIRGERGEP